MEKRPACLAPWKVLSIKPNGGVVPDTQFVGQYGNIKRQDLTTVWSSEEALDLRRKHLAGLRPEACKNCWRKERSAGHSRRIFFNDTLAALPFAEDFREDAPPDIVYLDVNLSNACNLKCRMCNGVISSSWRSDEKALASRGDRLYPRVELKEKTKLKSFQIEELLKDRRHFRNLRYLALRGGEPFLEKENEKLLRVLIDWGLAAGVVVDLSTNGAIVNQDFLRLLRHFKSTDLYVSVEAVGDLYQYIRGGDEFTIADLEENLSVFRDQPRLNMMFAVTTSIYNILYLDEVWRWFLRIRQPGEEIHMSNIVVNPEYLNFQILPPSYKKEALERLEAASIPEGAWFSGRRWIRDIGATLIKTHLRQETMDEVLRTGLLEQFLDFNRDLDRLRGTSLAQVAPEIAKLYEPSLLAEAVGGGPGAFHVQV